MSDTRLFHKTVEKFYFREIGGKKTCKWVIVGSIVGLVEESGSTHETNNTTAQTTTNHIQKEGQQVAVDYFERKLDDKRRLTMPAELRSEFASGVVVTRGFGNYLHLYPQAVWDREVEAALAGSILDEEIADLNVRFRRGKISAELDQKQGRVTVEQHLLDYAGIEREVEAVRVGQYFRIMAAGVDV